MSDGFVILVDPDKLAQFVAHEDPGLRALIEGSEEEPACEQDCRFESVIRPLLALLPPREGDMVEMYFITRMKQKDLAYIFGISQAAVSYILHRAAQRLKFLIDLPPLSLEEIRTLLEKAKFSESDIQILLAYRESTVQSEVATRVGKSQHWVRCQIHKAAKRLRVMAELDPTYASVAKLVGMLRDQPCILSYVRQPRFAGKGQVKRDDRFA